MNLVVVKSPKKVSKLALLAGAGLITLSAVALPFAASAQTTTTTTPAGVLDPMKDGANDMDDLAGLAAAMGISSAVFGAGALIFKRFIYS